MKKNGFEQNKWRFSNEHCGLTWVNMGSPATIECFTNKKYGACSHLMAFGPCEHDDWARFWTNLPGDLPKKWCFMPEEMGKATGTPNPCRFEFIWRFPKMGVPLNHPFWGSPTYGNPHFFNFTMNLQYSSIYHESHPQPQRTIRLPKQLANVANFAFVAGAG